MDEGLTDLQVRAMKQERLNEREKRLARQEARLSRKAGEADGVIALLNEAFERIEALENAVKELRGNKKKKPKKDDRPFSERYDVVEGKLATQLFKDVDAVWDELSEKQQGFIGNVRTRFYEEHGTISVSQYQKVKETISDL